MGWKELEEDIKKCRKCGLWRYRNNPVIGDGSKEAEILLIGEAPGFWEDIKGKPFVGELGAF